MADMFRLLDTYKDDGPRGFLLEVTFHVHKRLHNIFPFAPVMKGKVPMEWLSPF